MYASTTMRVPDGAGRNRLLAYLDTFDFAYNHKGEFISLSVFPRKEGTPISLGADFCRENGIAFEAKNDDAEWGIDWRQGSLRNAQKGSV